MAKRKIQSTCYVTDGAGGMVPVADRRFEAVEWPICDDIPADLSDDWFAHMNAECSERGWSNYGLSQEESQENSGSSVIHAGIAGQSPALEIVWERARNGPIRLKARPAGAPPMDLQVVMEFLDAVRNRCQGGTAVRLHRRGHLIYEGLPWRGELWLASDLRLGPPSRHAEWAFAPQIVIVDAEVDGIGWQGVNSSFALLLRELSIFLSVVVGIRATLEKCGWAWTCERDGAGSATNCHLRSLGYLEAARESGMPQAGQAPTIPLREVQRPGLGPLGINMADTEQAVPQDTVQLWQTLNGLGEDKRAQFLRAGNAYQIACSLWPDQMTAWAAFMVIACESLKPVGKPFDNRNIYDVVEALVGHSESRELRQLRLPPQRVRSRHLHRGELAAGELVPALRQMYFCDPSFQDPASQLARIARTCLIEWLRKGGNYALDARKTSTRRSARSRGPATNPKR